MQSMCILKTVFLCSVFLVPPSLADEAADLLVTKLSPVVIPCTASGVPLPTIYWTKNGIRLLPRGDGYRILSSGYEFTIVQNTFWSIQSILATHGFAICGFTYPWEAGASLTLSFCDLFSACGLFSAI